MTNPLKNFNVLHVVLVGLAAFVAYAKSSPTPLLIGLGDMAFGALTVLGVVTGSALPGSTPEVK